MEEIWKDIPGYEGCYIISNLGRIKSLERYVNHVSGVRIVRERFLKTCYRNDGYAVIYLNKCGKRKTKKIHRLLAEIFLNCPVDKEVNHIDGDTSNYSLNNLEIVSHSENMKHAYRTGLNKHRGIMHHKSKLNENDVYEIRKKLSQGLSCEKIGILFNVSHQAIRDISKGSTWGWL